MGKDKVIYGICLWPYTFKKIRGVKDSSITIEQQQIYEIIKNNLPVAISNSET
jgi:hypothetical protein